MTCEAGGGGVSAEGARHQIVSVPIREGHAEGERLHALQLVAGGLQFAEEAAAVAGLLLVHRLVELEAAGAGEGQQVGAEAGLAG